MNSFELNQSGFVSNGYSRRTAGYTVKLKDLEFEGPLDLLLFLVKKTEININDISIAEITSQYLSYLSLLINMDLDNISEFIEMAATLIYIKSRSILPVENDYEEDEQDPRDELINRLLEYQKYKIASATLLEYSGDNLYVPRKGAGQDTFLFPIEKSNATLEVLSVLDLVNAFAQVMKRKAVSQKKTSYEIEKLECTVEEKIQFVRSLLSTRTEFHYFEIVHAKMSKVEIACCFLAILELVKQGEAVIKQQALFGDISVLKKEELEAASGS